MIAPAPNRLYGKPAQTAGAKAPGPVFAPKIAPNKFAPKIVPKPAPQIAAHSAAQVAAQVTAKTARPYGHATASPAHVQHAERKVLAQPLAARERQSKTCKRRAYPARRQSALTRVR
jgi:hypothetical protein